MCLALPASPAVHGCLQFRLSEPELALGFDGGAQGRYSLPRLRQECEQVDVDAAETQIRFIGDDVAKRYTLALVVPGDIVSRAIDPERIARFRADVHWLLSEAIECLVVGFRGLPNADLAAVEDWNLELHVEAVLAERSVSGFESVPVDPREIEQSDESGGLSKIEGFRQSCEFDAGDLEV